MNPIEKRKAELREYIEEERIIFKTEFSARIAEQLLECIEALEFIPELINVMENEPNDVSDFQQFTNEIYDLKMILNKIAGEK